MSQCRRWLKSQVFQSNVHLATMKSIINTCGDINLQCDCWLNLVKSWSDTLNFLSRATITRFPRSTAVSGLTNFTVVLIIKAEKAYKTGILYCKTPEVAIQCRCIVAIWMEFTELPSLNHVFNFQSPSVL